MQLASHPARSVAASALILLPLALSGTASAAAITEIRWEATDGFLTGPNAQGRVRGGFFRLSRSETNPLATPGTGRFAWTLSLTRLSQGDAKATGFFMQGGVGGFAGRVEVFASADRVTVLRQYYSTLFLYSNGVELTRGGMIISAVVQDGVGSGFISYPGFRTIYSIGPHYFVLGNEVRTVPEPSPPTLLALSLLGAAGLVSLRAVRRRRGRLAFRLRSL